MFVCLFCFYQNGLKDIYFSLWIVLQYYHSFAKLVTAKATRHFDFCFLCFKNAFFRIALELQKNE